VVLDRGELEHLMTAEAQFLGLTPIDAVPSVVDYDRPQRPKEGRRDYDKVRPDKMRTKEKKRKKSFLEDFFAYVWLPYAVAALVFMILGLVAALRRRRSRPGAAEFLLTSGALLAVLAAVILGLADGAIEHNGLASVDPVVWAWAIEHRTPALTALATVVTEIGSTTSMAILASVTTLLLWIRGRRGDAVLVAVVAAGAGLLVSPSRRGTRWRPRRSSGSSWW
jgi:Zn-finger nucleic acid-binding protein